MGFLDAVERMAGQVDESPNAKVAGSLMEALDEHPGGLAGVLDNFRNNGMAGQVQSWARGQQQTATPEQVQQGLGNTGLIDRVAAKAGVSPETAKIAMATLLPILISHFTTGGKHDPPQSGFGGMASQILGKFL